MISSFNWWLVMVLDFDRLNAKTVSTVIAAMYCPSIYKLTASRLLVDESLVMVMLPAEFVVGDVFDRLVEGIFDRWNYILGRTVGPPHRNCYSSSLISPTSTGISFPSSLTLAQTCFSMVSSSSGFSLKRFLTASLPCPMTSPLYR